MLLAFDFGSPDRLPVYYQASTAGLYVHGQRLLDLFKAYPPDNAVRFDSIPQPPKEAFDSEGRYHEFKPDEFGTVWEYRIFGVAGHPHSYAMQSWSDPLPFPPLPAPGSAEFEAARQTIAEQKRNYLTFGGWISLFEKLHALRPFAQVLMDLADENPALLAFLDRLTEFRHRQIAQLLAIGTDVLVLGDDWGTQTGLLVSPTTFRRIFKPRIRELIAHAKSGGGRVLYHTCGAAYPLYRDLVETGINALWHQDGLYDHESFAREAAANRTLLFLHPDRQYLVPRGTPEEIRSTIRRYREIHSRLGGGAVFNVEIENDAPFENVEALIKAVHER